MSYQKKKKKSLMRPRVTFRRSLSKLKVQLMARDKESLFTIILTAKESIAWILFPSWLYFQNFVFLHACLPSCSVVRDSLHPFGLYSSRLLNPWGSPGKNTGVGCHASPGISSWPRNQTCTSCASCIAGEFLTCCAVREALVSLDDCNTLIV